MSSAVVFSVKWLTERWLNNRAFAIWTTAILAVLVRIGVSFALKTYHFHPRDDHFAFGYEWGRIARWLLERGIFSNDGTTPTGDTDPLYVFVIAPFFQIFGTFSVSAAIALITFQSILCGLSAWALFVLAEKIYGPAEARLSALFFAFYPGSIAFAVARIGPSSISILLICLIFILVLEVRNSGKFWPALVAGLLMGGLILTTAHVASLVLVVPLWLLLFGRARKARLIILSIVFVGATCLILLPWSSRNSLVLGRATLSKANLGFHIWVGNNPHATGYMRTTPIPDDQFYLERGEDPDYVRMAASWIAENPQDFMMLTLKRIEYFWYKIPDEKLHQWKSYKIYEWFFLTILALALVGVGGTREHWPRISLPLLFILSYPILFYLTHVTHYRHRFNIEPFLLIFAAHGICRLLALCPLRFAKRVEVERSSTV